MNSEQTREPQYQRQVDMIRKQGVRPMGIRASAMWKEDPRMLLVAFSRNKFVSKMLSGKHRVLEVGCGDGFPARIVQQEVDELHMIDFDPLFIRQAQESVDPDWPYTAAVHDILSGPYQAGGLFDAAYSLDVIEHIPKEHEETYLRNISRSLSPNGVLIVGSPSIQSQPYASLVSKEGHINCKDGQELKVLMQKFYHNVFLFSMNDEVVHTGFSPMAHYLFAIGAGNKTTA